VPRRSSPDPAPRRRKTAQRDAVQRVILESDGPLTVPEIHAHAAEHCDLGVATVYRNVNLLLEEGAIRAVVLPDGQNRYEAADLGHHHHFRCRACDRVFDLDLCPVKLPKDMTLPGGFHVDGHELTLYGHCPDCAAKPRRKRK